MITETHPNSFHISRPELKDRRLHVALYKPNTSTLRHHPASIGITGFQADSLDQAEFYALAILEAVAEGRKLDSQFLLYERANTQPKQKFIEFEDYPGHKFELSSMSNDEVDRALAFAEAKLKRKLKRDPRTQYPTFTIMEDGDIIAGG